MATTRKIVFIVALVLIGLALLWLLFGAIARPSEAANKMLCGNKLKELAIAAHDYHSAWERFPPGWLGPHPDSPNHAESPNVGVLVELLPYMGRDELFAGLYYQRNLQAKTTPGAIALEPGKPPSSVPWWDLTNPRTGTDNLTLATKRMKVLVCPSDDPYEATEGVFVALHVYGPAAPRDFLKCSLWKFADWPDAAQLGRTNYVGVAGCAGSGGDAQIPGAPANHVWGLYEGIFYNRSTTTLGQLAVQDGASNTLMFGEALGGLEPVEAGGPDVRRYSFSWFCGALPTMYGLSRGREWNAFSSPWYAFGSKHSAVVQFARGDGSVIGVRRGATAERFSNDWWVFQEMAGKRDGGLRATSMLTD